MLTLLYSLLENATITISQEVMAWITLAIDLISSAYLIYKLVKSKSLTPQQLVKLIKKNVKGNDLNKIAKEITEDLLEVEEKEEEEE